MTIDAERAAYEIQALANETANRVVVAVEMLKAYRRGFPTGGTASGDGSSRTEVLALAGPDAIDRDHHELERSLERALAAMRTAYNITARYERASRPALPTRPRDDDGWCISCQRNDGHCEPVAEGRYVSRCRFCGEYLAAQGLDPPVELLRARHEGRRITTALVDMLANGQARKRSA